MQNKANFQKVKFDVTNEMKKDYEKWTLGVIGKTKPIQSQFKANLKNAKMNVNKVITKEYEKMSTWAIYPKQSQFKGKKILAGRSVCNQ